MTSQERESFEPDLLEERLQHRFADPELLRQARIHRSYAHEMSEERCNEPLEFLGDAILGFLVADQIVRERPDLDEGGMTRLRSALVNTRSLAAEAEKLGLGQALLLGRGEDLSGGREKPALLADAFEAIVGALYLDGGLDPVRRLVERLFGQRVAGWPAQAGVQADPKTRLQEWCQSRGWDLPQYVVVGEEGPDHSKHFVVQVLVQGEPAGQGEGTAKKRAEQTAAARALDQFARRKNRRR